MRKITIAGLFAALLLLSTSSFANPCTVAITVSPSGAFQFPNSGGSSQFFVNTGGNGAGLSCTWSGSNTPGISISPASGGGGSTFQTTVGLTVFANPNLAPRNGSVTITQIDQTFVTIPVNQDAATGDFQISANPTSITSAKGSNASTALSITRSGGFTGTVSLTASGQPSGVTIGFSPNGVTGSSSTMTATVASGAPTGNFPITVTGSNGNVARTTTVMLVIQPVCGSDVCATMLSDGTFEVLGSGGNVLWTTGATGGSIAKIGDDGNFAVYKVIWLAGTYVNPPAPGPFAPESCAFATLLHAPQTIPSGQCIASPNRQYILYMAPDGNFFIYNYATGTGTWGPGTYNHPGAFAYLQTDGNFVVYDSTGTVALWNSATYGTGATLLDMENDGRAILYKPVFQSFTSQGWNTINLIHPSCDVGTGTGITGVLGVGQCFVSPDGRYQLLLQANGELVLSDLSVTPNTVLWHVP
jgi:hypothetical protein